MLSRLIRDNVADLTDIDLLEKASEREETDKTELKLVKNNWSTAVDFLQIEGYGY